MTGNLLQLSMREPFGVGGRRLCYEHPYEKSLCVKVLRTDVDRTVRLKNSSAWKNRIGRIYDNNEHERCELDKLYAKHGDVLARHFPKHYGYIDTDLGPGLVLDLMRDDDGEISMSLREWITVGRSLTDLGSAFQQFGEFLSDYAIVTRDLLDHNLVAVKHADQSLRLVMIDGIGNAAFVPIASWIKPVARMRIKRKLERAWARMLALQERGGISTEILNGSSWGQGLRYNKSINARLRKQR